MKTVQHQLVKESGKYICSECERIFSSKNQSKTCAMKLTFGSNEDWDMNIFKTKTMWKKEGYKLKNNEEPIAYVYTRTHHDFWALYNIEQVEKIEK